MTAGRDEHALGAQAERLAASGDRGFAPRRDRPGPAARVVAGAYLAVGGAAAAVDLALGRDPLSCSGWLDARGPASWLVSLGLGVLLGAVTIAATPPM